MDCCVKVVDFIKKLEDLGYDDQTTIDFVIFNEDGYGFNLDIHSIDDEGRQYADYNNICVEFNENNEYIEDITYEKELKFESLEMEILSLLDKY